MSMQTITTNQEFADRIGCHFTMASRLLNGQRFPSLALMQRIHDEYGISMSAMLKARTQSTEVFGVLLRAKIR